MAYVSEPEILGHCEIKGFASDDLQLYTSKPWYIKLISFVCIYDS